MTLDWLPADLRPIVAQVTDAQRVAATLFGEARSEPVQGIVAVANVLRNRVKSDLHADAKPDWWGEGYSGVCLAPHQFSCWTPAGGQRNYDCLVTLMQQFAAGIPITDPGARECIGIAHLVTGDYLRDNTQGSTHYHVATMVPRPSWAQKHIPVVQHGSHCFYSGIK